MRYTKRNKATYQLENSEADTIKNKMLNWASQFSISLFLDNNNYSSSFSGYECLLAIGERSACITLEDLQHLHASEKDWLFGHIAYDYKNILEPKLESSHKIKIGFSLLHFFVPQTVCYINRQQTELTIESFDDTGEIYKAITSTTKQPQLIPKITFNTRIEKADYISAIERLRAHIADGDCYEINFCNEGFAENVTIDPIDVFTALKNLSPAPFAAYYRHNDKYMMCASPERYLRKDGCKITSQPIKGTASRDTDAQKDQQNREKLQNSIKERAENVMITDLVRNDLAHCCEPGSIKVEELFGIYSFPQVHQMISTVSGKLKQKASFVDAIRYSFPMGSMTGAPKYKVMQLIEQYERSRRELYAGTVGYITPDGDFDFNVVIRSLFYNEAAKYLSFQTGGAITYDSIAEQEWEEMRLKAWALERIFL